MLPLLPARFHAFALDQRGHGLVAFDDAADLGRITASTLLIWGDHDGVVLLEDQQRLRDAIPAARLKVYPETAHSPHWERPERVAADLRPTASPVEWTAAVGSWP